MNKRLTKISKYMTFILRHDPQAIGMKLDPDGYLLIKDFIKSANEHGKSITAEQLHQVVVENEEQCFELSEDNLRIRAKPKAAASPKPNAIVRPKRRRRAERKSVGQRKAGEPPKTTEPPASHKPPASHNPPASTEPGANIEPPVNAQVPVKTEPKENELPHEKAEQAKPAKKPKTGAEIWANAKRK